MTFLLRGSGFVGSDSPQRGASLALSGMAGQDPCIPLSAHSIAAGIPLDAGLSIGQCFDEEEDLILEDNGCPGVQGARLHGPGQAEPFRRRLGGRPYLLH